MLDVFIMVLAACMKCKNKWQWWQPEECSSIKGLQINLSVSPGPKARSYIFRSFLPCLLPQF